MSHDSSHSPEEIKKHVRFYIGVFIGLLILTGITVWVSTIHIGPPESNRWNVAVGLIIAALKAGLVAAFFMHLNAERPLVYKMLIATAIFVIGLFALTYLSFWDPIPVQF